MARKKSAPSLVNRETATEPVSANEMRDAVLASTPWTAREDKPVPTWLPQGRVAALTVIHLVEPYEVLKTTSIDEAVEWARERRGLFTVVLSNIIPDSPEQGLPAGTIEDKLMEEMSEKLKAALAEVAELKAQGARCEELEEQLKAARQVIEEMKAAKVEMAIELDEALKLIEQTSASADKFAAQAGDAVRENERLRGELLEFKDAKRRIIALEKKLKAAVKAMESAQDAAEAARRSVTGLDLRGRFGLRRKK